jgi:hypothetical protein
MQRGRNGLCGMPGLRIMLLAVYCLLLQDLIQNCSRGVPTLLQKSKTRVIYQKNPRGPALTPTLSPTPMKNLGSVEKLPIFENRAMALETT